MERKNNTIFNFLAQTLILFAVNIFILMLFAALFGEATKDMSTLYQLGSKGLSSTTMLQFLLSSATVTAFRNIFYSEKIFKKLMALWRAVFMLTCILIVHIVYIVVFGWFAFDNYLAWAGFIICFVGGFTLGLSFMILKTKLESRHYDELLSQYKDQREGDNENE